jgi:adenosine/AMP kinase
VRLLGPCLVRKEGNQPELVNAAVDNIRDVGAGHAFVIVLKNAFPINLLNAVKLCQEVCSIYCATANPVEVVVAETQQGRGILGVIDGFPPQGVEGDPDSGEEANAAEIWLQAVDREFRSGTQSAA